MRFVAKIATLIGFLSLGACSEQEVVAQLRSLSGSEDAVFLCRDGNGVGHPNADCPDFDATDDTNLAKQLSLMALVSQTLTDEVAIVNVSSGSVVDVDPRTPGFGFLPVGGRPVAMAATPGGSATFVATADAGHNGIFALPTTCLAAPAADDPPRDLTTWPACRLHETPGEIAVIVQHFDTAPAADSAAVPQCTSAEYPERPASEATCTANLRTDGGPVGRRKLVVALPDSGRLVVIDAQQVLDAAPGRFPDCVIEATIPLKVDVPAGVTQALPPDLQTTCTEFVAPTAPKPGARPPQPAGFAVADNKLFVADQGAPVIHVLDTTSVCNMTELPSLLPMSLREPERVVTTRKVAVSPLTPAGKRWAYAIDGEDQPGASVMIFDVSPGSTDPTPFVRPGSPELLGEKPDRLALSASAKDVTFAYRDIPYVDPTTGVGEFGTRCDPTPSLDVNLPGAIARPNADFTLGARPGLLRGLFGFILQTNGTIAIVDVDDFDADCRRPVSLNTNASVADFRGCIGDPQIDTGDCSKSRPLTSPHCFSTVDGPTATDEVSCRVVEPHRFRNSRLSVNDSTVGVHAPSLRGFPLLTLPTGSTSTATEDRPRLLGVPFADPSGSPVKAEVFVGPTQYDTEGASGSVLPTDPNYHGSDDLLTAVNAVVLPPLEPRSYATEDSVTLTYEGSFAGDRVAGFLTSVNGQRAELTDASLSFCRAGVYDVATMAAYGAAELGLAEDDAATFGQGHSDYVELTTDFPAEDDAYWRDVKGLVTRDACVRMFGAPTLELNEKRELHIVSAFSGKLLLEPKAVDVVLDLTKGGEGQADVVHCFPTVQKYRLRAAQQWILMHSSSGFRHDVVIGPDDACVRSCSPLHKWDRARVFEISSKNDDCEAASLEGASLEHRVGCADQDVACVYSQSDPDDNLDTPTVSSAVTLDGRASKCIFNGLNARFAVYRGRVPSKPGSVFTWATTGGFVPQVMSLSNLSSVVSPQSILYLQQPEQMAVVDGSSQGLSLFSLDTFAIVKPSPFY